MSATRTPPRRTNGALWRWVRSLRPISHQSETASVVDHLEELRWRIVAIMVVVAGAFIAGFIERNLLFAVLNRPLDGRFTIQTLGVTEPLFTAITVAANAAFAVAVPVIVYNGYRFVAPALSAQQRAAVRPAFAAAPALFLGGVVFCYFLVLGPAVTFLLGLGQPSFDVTLRAQEYYSFAAMTLLAMGLVFCFPLVLVGLGRAGLVTAATLRRRRKIALLAIGVGAALLPTADPVSLMIEMLPMLGLYELSILVVRVGEIRDARRASSRTPNA